MSDALVSKQQFNPVTATHLKSPDDSRRKLAWSEKPIRLWSPESKGTSRSLGGGSCFRRELLGRREGTAVGCLARPSPANTSGVSSRMERRRGSCWGGVFPNYLQLIVWMRITKENILADIPVWASPLLGWGPFRVFANVIFALNKPPPPSKWSQKEAKDQIRSAWMP